MTAAEIAIVNCFRSYEMGPDQMLFLSAQNCRTPVDAFNSATRSLVARGFMVRERPASAYSLTSAGYEQCISQQPEVARSRRKAAAHS